MNKTILNIEGMSCAGCVSNVEKLISSHEKIDSVSVNLISAQAHLQSNDGVDWNLLFKNLQLKGYDASFASHSKPLEDQSSSPIKVYLAGLISILCFLLNMTPVGDLVSLDLSLLVQFLMVVPLFFWAGLPFLKATFRFFKSAEGGMFALIGIAVSVAFASSVFATGLHFFIAPLLGKKFIYFEPISFILFFVLLGKKLERSALSKLNKELSELSKTVKSASYSKGDLISIHPGEFIPVDGEVVEGMSEVDQSKLTGESKPVFKSVSDQVFAGTLNGMGSLEIKVLESGESSVQGKIFQMTQDAQSIKPAIQQIADKISGIFVYVVLGISLLTLISWSLFSGFETALSYFMATMVVACPCALGLASPLAVAITLKEATKKGVLIGKSDVIEKLNSIDEVCFDKTGTLSTGEFTVSSEEYFADSIKYKIFSLAKRSEHLLSKSLTIHLKDEKQIQVDDFEAIAGKGITGKIESVEYYLGSPNWASEICEAKLDNHKEKTVILFFTNKEVLAKFELEDTLKKESSELISFFRARNIKTTILSGDSSIVVENSAKKLGADHFEGELLPDKKLRYVRIAQRSGKKILFVGDGINDAPVLSLADVSIAMGNGTGVAMGASDVTLLEGRLGGIKELFLLSEKGMKFIKQNLFLSFVYNVSAIPAAAGIFVPLLGWSFPPHLAALAMGLSSISVVLNSLRLRS